MRALVSGASGVAVTFTDGGAVVSRADGTRYDTREPHLQGLFWDESDIDAVRVSSVDESESLLASSFKLATCLRLALIVLDTSNSDSLRADAADCANNEIDDDASASFIRNRLSVAPFDHDIATPVPAGRLQEILSWARDRQEAVARVRMAFDIAKQQLSADEQARALTLAADAGVFSDLVEAIHTGSSTGLAAINAHTALAGLSDYRAVVAAWLAQLAVERPILSYIGAEIEDWGESRTHKQPGVRGSDSYDRAKKQIDKIIALLRDSKLDRASKFIDELVSSQVSNDGAEFAAKSLCLLSQEARSLGAHALQLDLARRAYDSNPDDPKTLGHVADAFHCVGDLGNAWTWYGKAAREGDPAFGYSNQARVLIEQGRFDDAEEILHDVIEQWPEDDGGWLALAESYRKQGKYVDAIAAYERSAELFPLSHRPRCALAATLTDAGELDRALAIYDQTEAELGRDEVLSSGRAHVLSELGRLDEAEAAYTGAIVDFPSSAHAMNGLGHVLRHKGEYGAAISQFKKSIRRFPFEPVNRTGLARALCDSGQIQASLREYAAALRKFPLEPHVTAGYANALRLSGDPTTALKIVDRSIRKIPDNAMLRCVRADLLRHLGKLVPSFNTYVDISRAGQRVGARAIHGQAAVLIAGDQPGEALALLEIRDARTREEWHSMRLRGLALRSMQQLEDARSIFEIGASTCPFVQIRDMFRCSLASVLIEQQHLDTALEVVAPVAATPAALVVRSHLSLVRDEELPRLVGGIARAAPPLVVQFNSRVRAMSKSGERDTSWMSAAETRILALEIAA